MNLEPTKVELAPEKKLSDQFGEYPTSDREWQGLDICLLCETMQNLAATIFFFYLENQPEVKKKAI